MQCTNKINKSLLYSVRLKIVAFLGSRIWKSAEICKVFLLRKVGVMAWHGVLAIFGWVGCIWWASLGCPKENTKVSCFQDVDNSSGCQQWMICIMICRCSMMFPSHWPINEEETPMKGSHRRWALKNHQPDSCMAMKSTEIKAEIVRKC